MEREVRMTDVAIIGGGAAGISASLTLIQLGKTATIVSTAPEDSPLWKAELVDNYPGLPDITGKELIDRLYEHAKKAGAEFKRGKALSVMSFGKKFGISVGSEYIEAKAIVLALGTAKAKGFPGEREFLGRGVSYCATCDGMLYRNKTVAVIGLAADAREEAEFLESLGCKVEYFDLKRARKSEIIGYERVEPLITDLVR